MRRSTTTTPSAFTRSSREIYVIILSNVNRRLSNCLKLIETNLKQSHGGTTQSKRAEEDDVDPSVCGPGQREFTTNTVGDVLSGKQLLVRRGLTLVIMIILLVAGVIISNWLVRLLK